MFCKRSASSTLTLVNLIRALGTMRSAILLSMTSISTPSCSGLTTKQWGLPVSLFTANTGMTSDTCAPPIHFFSPLITQVSPWRSATVSRPPATSEPCSGSVKAKHVRSSCDCNLGTYFAICFFATSEIESVMP